jgi:Ser/Thr protein kinase RdoA (MazF antagonist)
MLEVLAAYWSPITTAHWTPLGSAGGFSGARLWHGTAADGQEFALKAHPPATAAGRLTRVHRWMTIARQAGLDFVPAVMRTRDNCTVIEMSGRPWDVTTWLPGRADFHAAPTDAKLLAAITALARLHDSWAGKRSSGSCPAIQRRVRALADWQSLIASGWQPRFGDGDPYRSHAEAVWPRLQTVVPCMATALAPWLAQVVPLQPCLCDIWHDHVLFAGNRVTGLIDYGAAKVDNVAVDLARLLGSLIPDDPQRIRAALDAYSVVRPPPDPELVRVLDASGVVIGVINWLRWLYYDRREYNDLAAVANRLARLVRRLMSEFW